MPSKKNNPKKDSKNGKPQTQSDSSEKSDVAKKVSVKDGKADPKKQPDAKESVKDGSGGAKDEVKQEHDVKGQKDDNAKEAKKIDQDKKEEKTVHNDSNDKSKDSNQVSVINADQTMNVSMLTKEQAKKLAPEPESIGVSSKVEVATKLAELSQQPQQPFAPSVSKISWYGPSKYDIVHTNKFKSNYMFAQSKTAFNLFMRCNIQIGDFDTLPSFLIDAWLPLIVKLRDEYRGIISDVPTQTSKGGIATYKYAPTLSENIGNDAIINYQEKIAAPGLKSDIVNLFRDTNPANDLSRTPKYNYVNASVIAIPWERELIAFLHNAEFEFYYSTDQMEDAQSLDKSPHISKTVEEIYQYLMLFNMRTIVVNPQDAIYEAMFQYIGTRVPFVPVDNNFALMMDSSIQFRNKQLERATSYYKDLFVRTKIQGKNVATAQLMKELSVAFNVINYANDVKDLVNRQAINEFLPHFAAASMFGKSFVMYCPDQARNEPLPNRVVSLILERLLLKSCMVAPDYRKISMVLLIVGFLSHFKTNPNDQEFTMAYWNSAIDNIANPFDHIVGKLDPNLQGPLSAFFKEDEFGSGWASAGLAHNNRQMIDPTLGKYTTCRFTEPYFDRYINETTSVVQTEQFRRLENMVRAITNNFAARNLYSSVNKSRVNVILGPLNYLIMHSESLLWTFMLFSKIHYTVTRYPLARPLSDEVAFNAAIYGVENGIPNLLRPTLNVYEEMDRNTWEQRLKEQYATYSYRPTYCQFSSLALASIILSNIIEDPIDIRFDMELIKAQWGMSYALNMLQSDVIMVYTALKRKVDFLSDFALENIRYPQLRDLFLKYFNSRSNLDSKVREDITEVMGMNYYPPLDTGFYWKHYWEKIHSFAVDNRYDFGLADGVFYGNVKPQLSVISAPYDPTEPYLYLNVEDLNPEAFERVKETQLRSGLYDAKLGDKTTHWLNTDKTVFIQVPIRVLTEPIKAHFDYYATSADIWAAASAKPIDLLAANQEHKTYKLAPYQIQRLSKDNLSSTINTPFKPRLSYIVNVDPVETFSQADFITYMLNCIGYIEVFDKMHWVEEIEWKILENTVSAIREEHTEPEIYPYFV